MNYYGASLSKDEETAKALGLGLGEHPAELREFLPEALMKSADQAPCVALTHKP